MKAATGKVILNLFLGLALGAGYEIGKKAGRLVPVPGDPEPGERINTERLQEMYKEAQRSRATSPA